MKSNQTNGILQGKNYLRIL